jgi:hypothetical protein
MKAAGPIQVSCTKRENIVASEIVLYDAHCVGKNKKKRLACIDCQLTASKFIIFVVTTIRLSIHHTRAIGSRLRVLSLPPVVRRSKAFLVLGLSRTLSLIQRPPPPPTRIGNNFVTKYLRSLASHISTNDIHQIYHYDGSAPLATTILCFATLH